MMKIGTSGFRGIIGDNFNKENVLKIIQTICNIIERNNLKKEVFVGFDNRFMSEDFAKWICEVFAGNNIKSVLSSSSVPSPLVSFVTKVKKNNFGIMVTASHNPYMYNGLKVYVDDGKEPDSELEKILNIEPEEVLEINIKPFEKAKEENLIMEESFVKGYISSIISQLKFKPVDDKKIAFNVMNGSSLCAIEELKNQLCFKNIDLYNTKRDVSFNFQAPNPFIEEYVNDFKEKTFEKGYDFSFATDGDGDRIAVYDEKGFYHDGCEINSLLYYFALKEKGMKGDFVKNYSFSILANKIANKFGQKVIETKIGFKHITEELYKTNAIIGAENSGCEIKNHVCVKDGIIVFALLLEILSFYNKPLSEIFLDLKREFSYNMVYEERTMSCNNKKIIQDFLNNNELKFSKKVKEVGKLDGFKYYFDDDSWLLIRFSGTEDIIRFTSEQFSKEEINDIIFQAEEFIKKI